MVMRHRLDSKAKAVSVMNEMLNNDESHECAQMRRQFDLYELDLPLPDDAASFEMHFHNCASCRNWLANWDMVKVSLHNLEQVEVPDSVFDNIMAAVAPGTVAASLAPATVAVAQPTVAPRAFRFLSGDTTTMLLGFGILLLSFTIFASASLNESISWCVSFLLLVAFNQLTRTRTSLGVA
jgi:predicted anti-sigma-YlaC factor YlaD